MYQNLLPLARQQKMPFADEDQWQKLPGDVRQQCEERITQLLQAVILATRQERNKRHERQDPS
jgi:hypothetical protein